MTSGTTARPTPPLDGWGRSYSLSSELSPAARLVEMELQELGLSREPDAPTLIVLDAPRGHALDALSHLDRTGKRVVVLVWHDTPEYLDDLWELGPDILIARGDAERHHGQAIVDAMRRTPPGRQTRLIPWASSPLTPKERAVLKAIACGMNARDAADSLGIGRQTVYNLTGNVYDKLSIEERSHSALTRYYLGLSSRCGAEEPRR
jgi:DNA-binding NarL/FixJ family response regulator